MPARHRRAGRIRHRACRFGGHRHHAARSADRDSARRSDWPWTPRWAGRRRTRRTTVFWSAPPPSRCSRSPRDRPVLLLVDDLQWIDHGVAVRAVVCRPPDPARRGCLVFARRDGPTGPDLSGINEFRLAGLGPADAAALLAEHRHLPASSSGWSSTRREIRWPCSRRPGSSARRNSAGRRRCHRCCRSASGSAPHFWPTSRHCRPAPAGIGDRRGQLRRVRRTGGGGAARRGCRCRGRAEEAEQAGVLTLTSGALTFRHPLIRAAVWQQATAGERRSAHAALAAVLQDRPASTAAPGRSGDRIRRQLGRET